MGQRGPRSPRKESCDFNRQARGLAYDLLVSENQKDSHELGYKLAQVGYSIGPRMSRPLLALALLALAGLSGYVAGRSYGYKQATVESTTQCVEEMRGLTANAETRIREVSDQAKTALADAGDYCVLKLREQHKNFVKALSR